MTKKQFHDEYLVEGKAEFNGEWYNLTWLFAHHKLAGSMKEAKAIIDQAKENSVDFESTTSWRGDIGITVSGPGVKYTAYRVAKRKVTDWEDWEYQQ